MEESKTLTILVTVEKSSLISEDSVRQHLNLPNVKIETNSSPKGYKVELDLETANELLEKGEDTLNGEKINYAENDKNCTVYIKGGTDKITEMDLFNALKSIGRICMVSIPRGVDRKPKGTAFVRFNRKEDALKVKDVTVNDIELEISNYDDNQKDNANKSASFKNVPTGYGESELSELFGEYGEVNEVKLSSDGTTGTVFFSSSGSVLKAQQNLNGKQIGDKIFYITPNETITKRANQYNNLYVGNVDINATEDDIRAEFGKYGEIESLLMPTRKDLGIRKPFIYISFKDSKAASEVIK